MKKETENKAEKIEETKEQLMQSNQIMGTQLRVLQDEESLEKIGRYRRQRLILLEEQNQILKGIGLALNRIGMILENSREEEGEETEVVEASIPQGTEEIEEEKVKEEPEVEETEKEPEPIEEEPEPLSKEELKLQKKMDKIAVKMKKVKEKNK